MTKKIQLYNTLTKKKEVFEPIYTGQVSMYVCGPTVYDRAHIGNLRTYIFEDVLRRALKVAGFTVNEVMNITDIDDKMIVKSGGNKSKMLEIAKEFTQKFLSDIESLNIEKPENITYATLYIEKMVAFVEDLLAKGLAYKTQDGSVYFSISKYPQYGQLSGLDKKGLKTGARVNQDEYSKENPSDFALWKAWTEDDGDVYFETSLGKGRPGWHIECSAMSQDKLTNQFDIHGGAVDLIFPHHENEIAQSWGRTGKIPARFWVHGEHLLVDGQKMAKSLNNFYTLDDIKQKGFEALDFRFLALSAHYRTKLNFTFESLRGAHEALVRLRGFSAQITDEKSEEQEKFFADLYEKFEQAVFDDLDLPKALAVVFDAVRFANEKKYSSVAAGDFVAKIDRILSLDLGVKLQEKDGVRFAEGVPEEVVQLAVSRLEMRQNKDFEAADKVRLKIEESGYLLEDFKDYSLLVKK